MNFTIRKKPSKVTFFGVLGLLVGLGVAVILPIDSNTYFILAFALGNVLVFLLVKSFVVSYFGGVEIRDDAIEEITGLGGLLTIRISEIDHERSSLSSLGLVLVPINGESLFLSATEYSKSDILRLAHYVGMSDSGWSQHV